MASTENIKIQSRTVTNEETFAFTLELSEDGSEILSGTQTSYHCSECGNEVESEGLTVDEAMACEDHPSAIIDSVKSAVELVDTPTNLGEDSDTDVVFFTPHITTPDTAGFVPANGIEGSFGLQIRRDDGSLKAICDLDGETFSFSGFSWIIPDKVPAQIAKYAEAVCS
jgi:DNA-directed RNA polymerase subunit RPC12/RpoP